MENQSERNSQINLGLGLGLGLPVGISLPLGVYLVLKDASQDVKMVLVGGIICLGFAVLLRYIESRVQIAKERAEAYRDAVSVARDLSARQLAALQSGGLSVAYTGEEIEELFNGRHR